MSRQAAKRGRRKSLRTDLFAWRGLRFRVPPTWELSAEEGDAEKGYLRLDDESMIRLELRWERPRKRYDPAAVLESYLAKQGKAAKKSRQPVDFERQPAWMKTRPDLQVAGVTWRTTGRVVEFVSHCKTCHRVTSARLHFRNSEDYKGISARILEEYGDHPENGVIEWSAFGLRTAVPEAFALTGRDLHPGHIALFFRRGPLSITQERFALGETIMERGDLGAFLRTNRKDLLGPFKLEWTTCRYRGHPATRAGGVMSLRHRVKKEHILHRRRRLDFLAWYCEATDKVMVYSFMAPRSRMPAEDEREAMRGSLRCCAEAGEPSRDETAENEGTGE